MCLLAQWQQGIQTSISRRRTQSYGTVFMILDSKQKSRIKSSGFLLLVPFIGTYLSFVEKIRVRFVPDSV